MSVVKHGSSLNRTYVHSAFTCADRIERGEVHAKSLQEIAHFDVFVILLLGHRDILACKIVSVLILPLTGTYLSLL